jgi:nucleotide-binding universal stress UspA family protein
MNVRPSLLCPVDYSSASAGALRYAAAIAERLVTRLIVLSVEDPLLAEAVDLGTGGHWSREDSERELERFVRRTFGDDHVALAMCEYDVAVGKPAPEILRVARERSCFLIVMSERGQTGARKLFFGATTERVLRETAVPVLVTPSVDAGPIHVENAKRWIGRIVVPVDLSTTSHHQTYVAAELARTLEVPLLLVHVIEPVKSPVASRFNRRGLDADQRSVAEDGLSELLATIPRRLRPEALVAYGDPAEEAAKVVNDRHAGLVVMNLHGSPAVGPRMGSVTYRMLCLSQALMLAIPPKRAWPKGAVAASAHPDVPRAANW